MSIGATSPDQVVAEAQACRAGLERGVVGLTASFTRPPEIVTGWSGREQRSVNRFIVLPSRFELPLGQEIAAPDAR